MARRRFHCLAALLMLAFVLVQAMPIPVSATSGFSFALDQASACAGETVALNLQLGSKTNIAGFRTFVGYDDSKLKFIGTKTSSDIEEGTLCVNSRANPVCAVYVCNTDKGHAPALSGTVLTFLFCVRDGVTDSATSLQVSVDETCDYNGKNMQMDTDGAVNLQISHEKAQGLRLTALEPTQGTLSPAFSPGTFCYKVSVGSQVQSISFRTVSPEGTTVKISRHLLYAAGKETLIQITVSSLDGKEKTSYCVTVIRAAKGAETGQESTPATGHKSTSSAWRKRQLSSAASDKRKTSSAASGIYSRLASLLSSGQALGNSSPIIFAGSNQSAYFNLILGASLFAAIGIIIGLLLGRRKK
jgi:hypothetical protein